MNTQSNAMHDSPLDSQFIAAGSTPGIRSLYWSVRRELWENRSIYVAPLSVAAAVLFACLIAAFRLHALAGSYDFAEGLIMVTTLLVGVFYCLDALHSERRDRSILFWKSLPVSDRTAVLAKASVPYVILPLLTFTLTVATQWITLLVSSAVLLSRGLSVAPLWTHMSLFRMWLMLLYHLVTVHVLWHAPIYAWLLLVSAWARRAAFLWAILPPLAICVLEKIAFNTTHFATMLGYRFTGGAEAHPPPGGLPIDPGVHLTLGTYLSSPGLWIGLGITVAFLAAAVQLRRYRGPI